MAVAAVPEAHGSEVSWKTLTSDVEVDAPLGTDSAEALQKEINAAKPGARIVVPPGEIETAGLVIRNKKGLTLSGTEGKSWLVATDARATVLTVVDSEDIEISGIGLLHRVEAFCRGDAVGVYRSKRVTIDRCDLSGSGVAGVRAAGVRDLKITNNFVHHCTYEMISLRSVQNVTVENNLFRNNKEGTLYAEGLVLEDIWGHAAIKRNTFVDNACAAMSFAQGKDSGARARFEVEDNVFKNNRGPKPTAIHDVGTAPDEAEYYVPIADQLTFRGNCIEKKDGVAPGIPTADNYLGPIRLNDERSVIHPAACTKKGASVLLWPGRTIVPKSRP